MSAAAPESLASDSEFALLLGLVGEPFLFARLSYGDELVLHFGERRADAPRVIKGREFRYEHGTYSLHVRGSSWVVKSATVVGSDLLHDGGPPPDSLRTEAEAAIGTGTRVTAVIPFAVDRPGVSSTGLRVEMANGATVVVIPTPDDDSEPPAEGVALDPLADWELHTPNGIVAVYPGRETQITPRGS